MNPKKGLIVWLSVLSGLQSLASASAFADVVGAQVSALALATTAALTMGTATYIAGLKGHVEAPESPANVAT